MNEGAYESTFGNRALILRKKPSIKFPLLQPWPFTINLHSLTRMQLKTLATRQAKRSKHIPLPADNDLLAARELELGTAKGLLGMVAVAVLAPDWEQDLTDGNPSTCTLWLSKSTPHTSLEPISPSAGKHLVNTENMEGVDPHSQMESILSSKFGHVLIASNPSCFQGLTRNILLLPTHQVNTEGELIHTLLFHSNIIDSDLRIRNTTAVPWFRVRLVLDLPITPCRSYDNHRIKSD